MLSVQVKKILLSGLFIMEHTVDFWTEVNDVIARITSF